jgi:plasmid replication initiation protein
MSLPSIYSQRLYEVLKSWSDKPEIEIEIEELHYMLDTPNSLRENFAYFRKRVLEQAHKDIVEREGSSLRFNWEPIKASRGKVIAIRFVFSEVRSQELSKNQQSPDEISVHHKLQQQSNTCYENTAKNGISCTPNMKTKKCEFCTTRGRMSRNSK